jgi:multiple sugar transport system permease protein
MSVTTTNVLPGQQPPGLRRPTRTGRPTASIARRDSRAGLVLVAPTLAVVVLMVFLPLVWSLIVSFQRLRLINISSQGLFDAFTIDNFALVLGTASFWNSLWITFVFTVGSVAGSIALGVIAALALRRPFRGRTFVRASMLLPYVAPVVAVTFVWRIMLNPEFGIVNALGQRVLGWAEPIPFLTQATGRIDLAGLELPVPVALLTVIMFQIWRFFPFAFLFVMARMEAMPHDIEEAALVDGATPWQTFRHVVLPQLVPVLTVLVVLRSIWTFNEFDSVFLLTGGAAGTQVASIGVYQLLTVQQNVGAASAQSIILAVILVIAIGAYAAVLRRTGSRFS